MNDAEPVEPAGSSGVPPDEDEVQVDRRRFFSAFAADALALAATVAGAAGALRLVSAEAAGSLLAGQEAPVVQPDVPGQAAGSRPAAPAGAAPSAGAAPAGGRAADVPARVAPSAAAQDGDREPQDAPAPGFRGPFRLDGDALVLLDQRRLPDEVAEVRCVTGADVALAIRDLVVRGAPALGQVAAYGLALAAGRVALSAPWARRAVIGGAADALRTARPTAVNVRWAIDRMMARFAAEDGERPDGHAIARALREEADAIAAEATADHSRMAALAAGLVPWFADRPTRVLTHCNTGPLACGQVGTALGVVQVAHAAGRSLHVYVDETRPWLQGSRLTAWELGQAGVPYSILADAAAGWLLASGQVDAVLVGADRIAANGDTANKIGTYPLAVLAGRHGVPFLVVAPTSSVDLDTPDGPAIPIEMRIADEVLGVRGRRIAPAGAEALNPVFDVTPAELVTAIVTEEGVLRAPYESSLAAAVTSARARRPSASRAAGPGREP
jgi:methylthioribose-1-phosphate isomerase